MTLLDNYNKNVPDYYGSMYLDGYTPYHILYSLRRGMIQDHEDRQMIDGVKIVSEVKLK